MQDSLLHQRVAAEMARDRLRYLCPTAIYVLRFSHPDRVPLQTRQVGLEGTGEIRLRHVVKESLRMRPSRLVVGEVRAEECLDLLLALNAGLPGMASMHANSAREALVKGVHVAAPCWREHRFSRLPTLERSTFHVSAEGAALGPLRYPG